MNLSLPGNADPGQTAIQHQGQHFVLVPLLDQILKIRFMFFYLSKTA